MILRPKGYRQLRESIETITPRVTVVYDYETPSQRRTVRTSMKREEQAEISSLIASLEKQGVLMRYHARVRHVGNGDPLGPIFEHRVLGISPLVARMLRAINGMPVSELMKKGQRG